MEDYEKIKELNTAIETLKVYCASTERCFLCLYKQDDCPILKLRKISTLTDQEKKYMRTVIAPYGSASDFDDAIEFIVRAGDGENGLLLQFVSPKGKVKAAIDIVGGMFKGMELDRHYPIEELGL